MRASVSISGEKTDTVSDAAIVNVNASGDDHNEDDGLMVVIMQGCTAGGQQPQRPGWGRAESGGG